MHRMRGLAVLAVGAAAAAHSAGAPTLHGRIVFEATRTTRAAGLYVMGPDGSRLTRIPGTRAFSNVAVTRGAYAYTDGGGHVIAVDAAGSHDLGPGTPSGFSPNGRTVVVATRDAAWDLRDARTGAVLRTFPASLRYIGWSAGGLLFASAEALVVLQPDGSGERTVGIAAGQPDRAAWSPDGTWIAYFAQPDPTLPPELRVVRPDGSDDHALGPASVGDQLSWSPTGAQIAFASPQGVLRFAAPGTGTPVDTGLDVSTTPTVIGSWSPDGTRFACTTVTPRGRSGPVMIVSAATGVAHVGGPVAQTVSWSPNGKTLLVGAAYGIATVSATATDAQPKVLAPDVQSPTWLSDGRVLAYLNEETVRQLASVAPGGGGVRYIAGTENDDEPAPSPDGTKIVFASLGGRDEHWTITVANADGSHRRVLAQSHANLASPSWSPDGRFIAYAAEAAIEVIPSSGGRPRRVTGAELPWTVAWSPDGKEIAFGNTPGDSDFADIVLAHPDGTHRHVVVHGEAGFNWGGLAWSPDGRTIAFARRSDAGGDPDGNADLYLVDVRTHREHELGLYLSDPSFSPDGRQLAVANDDGTIDVLGLGHNRGAGTVAHGTHPSWSR